MSVSFEMLNLSKYDPTMDIIVVNVYVGKMKPKNAREYVQGIREMMMPLFKERGFNALFIPHRDGDNIGVRTNTEVSSNEELKKYSAWASEDPSDNEYDNAMKLLENYSEVMKAVDF